jgi:hypothetical protein
MDWDTLGSARPRRPSARSGHPCRPPIPRNNVDANPRGFHSADGMKLVHGRQPVRLDPETAKDTSTAVFLGPTSHTASRTSTYHHPALSPSTVQLSTAQATAALQNPNKRPRQTVRRRGRPPDPVGC